MTLLTPVTDGARRQLAHALRSRVAGDDARVKAERIWGAEGPRWFTPDDPIWRVHADASMFPAGIRALLLQSLHPLAMAGVAGHSGYKGDPWGRLQRTSEFLATTTFGTIEDAEALIARVRGIHERVRGKAPDGRPYSASDPHLLKWVHVTEADSFLTAYQRYAVEPLTDAEADRYVEQSCVVAAGARGGRPAEDGRGAAPDHRGLPPRARVHAPRHARRRASCSCTRPCRSRRGPGTRRWPRAPCRCSRGGPGARCGCRVCPSPNACSAVPSVGSPRRPSGGRCTTPTTYAAGRWSSATPRAERGYGTGWRAS